MCGLDPTMRSRSSCWSPVISASAMTSAMTPTVTPSVEMMEMTEMNACLRFASRYRSAMCSSKGRSIGRLSHENTKARNNNRGFRVFVLSWLFSRPHERKQDHVADREAVGEQHDEAIDADPFAAGRREAVFERADVVLVHRVRLEVAARAVLQLSFEAPALLDRVVELAEGVRDFEAADVQLEALDGVRVVRFLLRQRRHLRREVVDERRLNQPVLAEPLEDLGRDLAGAVSGIHLETELFRDGRDAIAIAQIGVRNVARELLRRRVPRRFAQREADERRRQRNLVIAE